MVARLFLQVLNTSIVASFVIIAVLFLRVLLKKFPKCYSYLLWSAVLFRLCVPLLPESSISIIPSTKAVTSGLFDAILPSLDFVTSSDIEANRLMDTLNREVPVYLGKSLSPTLWLSFLWLLGISILFAYNMLSLIKLRKKLVESVRLRDNIYLADHLAVPFVIGLFRPRIYLPSTISEKDRLYIIQHEQYHIRRFDHVVKILALAALCIHWFNPLTWIAFIFSIKDMEMSCDEGVIKNKDNDFITNYAKILLALTAEQKLASSVPLAFSKGGTKGRIRNMMQYKKPVIWIRVAMPLAVIALCIGFSLNPPKDENNIFFPNLILAETHPAENEAIGTTGNGKHELSQSGRLSTTAAQLPQYALTTNSEKIKVEISRTTKDINVELFSVDDYGNMLASFTLNDTNTSDTFTNLTAARTYYLTATGDDDATITVSESID